MDFPTLIQDASISIVSVASLVYVTYLFIKHIKEERQLSQQIAKESALALREVEKEVRTKVLDQLSQNTVVMNETVKSHERLMTAFQEILHDDRPRN